MQATTATLHGRDARGCIPARAWRARLGGSEQVTPHAHALVRVQVRDARSEQAHGLGRELQVSACALKRADTSHPC